MEILGIGPGELMLVFILALIFIGPGKMPEVAASLGRAIREFQRASAELTDALNAEIAAAQAEKAAQQVSENGHSEALEAAEAELVAQAGTGEVAPVAYTGMDVATGLAEPSPEPTEQPQSEVTEAAGGITAAAVQPEVAAADGADGLAPLPAALLAPSLPDGADLAGEAAPVQPTPATPEPRRDEDAHGLAPLPDPLLAPSDSDPSAPVAARNGTVKTSATGAGQADEPPLAAPVAAANQPVPGSQEPVSTEGDSNLEPAATDAGHAEV